MSVSAFDPQDLEARALPGAAPGFERAQAKQFYRSRSGRLMPVVHEVSAGGLVVENVAGVPSAAVISRRNRAGRTVWCLPKGHLEGLESPPQAAVREIFEETGIVGQIVCFLSTMDYWFSSVDRRVHKVVHHYLLEAHGGELSLENDPDHEAQEVAWMPLESLPSVLGYPNERRIARIAQGLLFGKPPAPQLRKLP